MKEKEIFVTPELDVIKFSDQDVVATSTGSGSGSGGGNHGIELPDVPI